MLFARHRKGFGIHSPFTFSFLTEVVFSKQKPEIFKKIESIRKELLNNQRKIFIKDYGSGSRAKADTHVKVNQLAKNSSIKQKYGKILFNAVLFIEPSEIIELGTSLGISTLYLAMANRQTKVYTVEGCPERSAIAKSNFRKLMVDNVVMYNTRFEESLATVLKINQTKNKLIFIDGNHNYQSTIGYFNMVQGMVTPGSVVIIDDIHWSKDMEKAWGEIKKYGFVTLTIDLFFMGIVFFNENLKGDNLLVRY